MSSFLFAHAHKLLPTGMEIAALSYFCIFVFVVDPSIFARSGWPDSIIPLKSGFLKS